MSEEAIDGAAAPADASLRDDLASAIATTPAEPSAEPAVESPAPEAPAEPQEPADQARDEQGRFAGKDAAQDPAKPPEAPQEPAGPEDAPEKAEPATPPPGWPPSAKAEFANLPDSVKQAVADREVEINNGFAKLQEYKPLDAYIEMAANAGTTLPQALERYVAAETMLESNPIQGILHLCQTYSVHPVALAQVAQSQMPQQAPSASQPDPAQAQQQVDLTPVLRQVEELRNLVTGERVEKTRTEIDAFFADTDAHPYAENVADQMASLIKSGVATDLQQAYDMACWNNPEIRDLLIKKQGDDDAAAKAAEAKRKADQARTAGASITGAPTETPSAALPDDLRASLEQQMGLGRV